MLACGAANTVEELADYLVPGTTLTMVAADAASLQDHVHVGGHERFDVIFIDGHARDACFAQARRLLREDGRIFLQDAQRPSYDEAKQLYVEHGTIGPCPEAQSHLWYGGLRPRCTTTPGELPVIVSYFTTGTPYGELAARLRASCDALRLRHHIVPLDPTGTWEANCAAKAQVCLDAWRLHASSIVWVDADAAIRRVPRMLAEGSADFAVHKWKGWRFASGTVFFGRTPLGGALLARWEERCRLEPRVWDQVQLDLAWEEITSSAPLHTMWLPRGYCQIFNADVESGDEIVIEHFQASRDLKALVTDGVPAPRPDGSEEFCRDAPHGRWLLSRSRRRDLRTAIDRNRCC
jgi:hypothetical protein